MMSRPWQEIAREAQAQRDASIAEVNPPEVPKDLPLDCSGLFKDLLTEDEIAITETLPEDLVRGAWSAVKIVSAFLKRAAIAHKFTNCITELMPKQALERAQWLDDYREREGKLLGPLHGVPISVKEHVGMRGNLIQDCGFVSWRDRKSDDEILILEYLWNAGAVFYARTTQPQTLMHLETSSNLYGETVNGFNRNLTSGGSSGGEGALIGMRGSCLGIGTDIGGSIRSPAANNGVFGFRPTTYRLPLTGVKATMMGQEHIVPVIGPLSTSLRGCKMFVKAIIDQKPWLSAAALVPMPWKEGKNPYVFESKKLKIAVMWHDDIVRPHPPVTRALKEVVEALKKHDDIEVVEWKPYMHDLAWDIIASLYFADGASEEKEAINASGEPWRPLSKFITTENENCKNLSIGEVWEWTDMRDGYRDDYAKIWSATSTDWTEETMVDAILCPVGPGAAPPLNHAKYWNYTSQWNLLDYPAAVFPVTKVDQEKDKVEKDYKPMNDQDQWNHDLYNPETYINAPVSLQLVGRRYEDEKVFEVLEYIMMQCELPFKANFEGNN